MAYDLEEQEKLDAIKDWWTRYGTLCVVLAFVVLAGILGWRGWQWYQTHQNTQAMGYYEALEAASTMTGEEADARLVAASATLRSDFPKSGYASRGALVAAWALQERGNADGAREQLEWLVQQGSDPAMKAVARLRLAGLLLEQKDFDAALAQLENPPAGFAGLYADRKGDILFAQDKVAEARAAWQVALGLLKGEAVEQLVQLKIDAVGEQQ
ncbi:tetratricopeptide repeat protein [Paenalcaligenes sp. Me52]|uniref:tetratricopeptide repeat protein n=1 Tax=Paenalcaligenes sp. Me52 TaxID=3392038 RepID=UPI003D2BABEF